MLIRSAGLASDRVLDQGAPNLMMRWRLQLSPAPFILCAAAFGSGHDLSMVEIEQSGAATAGAALGGNQQLVVPRHFKRNAPQVLAMAPSADTGLWLLQYLGERIGAPDLAGLDVLDFGCGSRFAEALTTHNIPLRSYVGIDVYREMIEFLTQNIRDGRLSFHHINARNPKYNKSGDPLTRETTLPIGDKRFDVICMFSVITHQLPHDAQAIFAILRRHVEGERVSVFLGPFGRRRLRLSRA
jgi:SAM-dependent methyltransferase